jgi:hypothetical protein
LNERAGPGSDLFITNLKFDLAFQNKKGFVFTRVNMRRRPVVWRNANLMKRVYASCLPARSQIAINVSQRREGIAFAGSEVNYPCVVRHDSWRARFDTV